jgi:hypothetical protein
MDFIPYWKLVRKQFWKDLRPRVEWLLVAVGGGAVGAWLLDYFILAKGQIWVRIVVAAIPALLIVSLYALYHAIRAPWKVHGEALERDAKSSQLLAEMSGRSELVVQLTQNSELVVTTDRPVYNVEIFEVLLPKPPKHLEFARKVLANVVGDTSGGVFYETWKLKFSTLQAVLPTTAGVIDCWVAGLSLPYSQALKYVLSESATSNELEVPITLRYSNTGTRKEHGMHISL